MAGDVLNFDQETIKVKKGDQVFDIRYPTSTELLDFVDGENAIDKNDTRKVLEHSHSFLESLGLPKDFSKSLSAKNTKELFKKLMGN